jgi:cytoplasmic iron level regulating protein YaaA (DUF328/UPF0246 family)
VHLLLPPSESKSLGGRGRPLHDRPAGAGPLDQARAATLRALAELADGNRARAAAALLLPPGVADDALAANAAVLDSPTTPALRRYTGTVYEGLAVATLLPQEQRLAARCTWIFSGLFGILRGDEPVPAYRVPAKAVLPGLGVASTFWRPVLAGVLDEVLRRGLIVDLRSGDYAAMWRPASGAADRVVSVRVLSPAPRGGHAVISYSSKLAKGRLAAALVRRAAAGASVSSVEDVAGAWLECGGGDCVEAGPRSLDLYTG